MVIQLALAAAGAAGTLLSGHSARKAAKKTQKLQIQAHQDAVRQNEARQNNAWRHNEKEAKKIGDWLKDQKEVTTERRTGADTHTSKASSSMSNTFDADAMMKAAEASGINPITFLRNGGMAAFIKTNTDSSTEDTTTYNSKTETTRKGHNAAAVANIRMQGEMRTPFIEGAAPISHVPGAQEAVGSAITSFANGAADYVKTQSAQDFAAAQADKHQAFQKELMMMSLGGVQAGGAIPGGRSFYTPGFSTSGPSIKTQTQGGLSGNPLASPTPKVGETTRTNPWPAWMGMEASPYRVDAEVGETAHGDIMESIWGLYNVGEDLRWNAGRYLSSSPTADKIKSWVKDLGIGLEYKRNDEPRKPLTFTVRPKPAK